MNYYEFGNRLRICRHKQDYSLQDVADMTQYSSKHIGNIERGQPSANELFLHVSHRIYCAIQTFSVGPTGCLRTN